MPTYIMYMKGVQPLAAVGNFLTTTLLLGADITTTLISFGTTSAVDLIDCLLGSGKATARKKIPWSAQRSATEPVYVKGSVAVGELDVPAMYDRSTFAFKPEDLIARCKKVLASEFGTAEGCDATELLADDFQFVAPVRVCARLRVCLGARAFVTKASI